MHNRATALIIALALVLGVGGLVYGKKQAKLASPPAHSAGAPLPQGITLAQIAQHGSASSCWSAINGSVYDLTSWIPHHPGGEEAILSICGIDGSSRFDSQHGEDARALSILAGFKIGVLAQ